MDSRLELLETDTFPIAQVGYAMPETNRLLDSLKEAVESDQPIAEMLARSSLTRVTYGYDCEQVDALLDQLRDLSEGGESTAVRPESSLRQPGSAQPAPLQKPSTLDSKKTIPEAARPRTDVQPKQEIPAAQLPSLQNFPPVTHEQAPASKPHRQGTARRRGPQSSSGGHWRRKSAPAKPLPPRPAGSGEIFRTAQPAPSDRPQRTAPNRVRFDLMHLIDTWRFSVEWHGTPRYSIPAVDNRLAAAYDRLYHNDRVSWYWLEFKEQGFWLPGYNKLEVDRFVAALRIALETNAPFPNDIQMPDTEGWFEMKLHGRQRASGSRWLGMA